MAQTLITVDLSKPPHAQEVLHNRGHPDIPMVAHVKPGDEFRFECVDWTGGQIANDDAANDVRDVDLTKVHDLSGPIGVEGAEPGDLIDTSSRHIPGVEFVGVIHPGLIGCLPSKPLLETWNKRERELFSMAQDRDPPLCTLPSPGSAHLGKLQGSAAADAAKEAARTVPPREHGGNCDIKNLTRGSKVFFPIYVNGAGLRPFRGRPRHESLRRRLYRSGAYTGSQLG